MSKSSAAHRKHAAARYKKESIWQLDHASPMQPACVQDLQAHYAAARLKLQTMLQILQMPSWLSQTRRAWLPKRWERLPFPVKQAISPGKGQGFQESRQDIGDKEVCCLPAGGSDCSIDHDKSEPSICQSYDH